MEGLTRQRATHVGAAHLQRLYYMHPHIHLPLSPVCAILQLGLKVVRIGKASAVSESLWDFTLDAAIDSDASSSAVSSGDPRRCMLNEKKF